MEIPDISKQHHSFPETDYTTVEFLALEILTSDEAKKYNGEIIMIINKCWKDTILISDSPFHKGKFV